MKKKPFALLLALCTLFASLAMFSACGNSPTRENANSLTYEKKYIYERDIASKSEYQDYYLFHSDNTGEYYNSSPSISSPSISSYTIKFKYVTIENESVACFYDSETGEGRSERYYWRSVLLYSPEIVYTSGGDIYVCETYLKEIPNFGK